MARKIGGIFGRRPFGPINEHMLKVMQSLEEFSKMMTFFIDEDFEKAFAASENVHILEKEADAIENDIKRRLSGSIFNSVERFEILQLLKAQDNLSDKANSIAKTVSLRRTRVPVSLKDSIKELCGKVVTTCTKYASIVRDLQDLERESLKGGFPGRISEAIEEVHLADDETGMLRTKVLKELFAKEGEVEPVSLLILRDIVEKMNGITGQAENAADVVSRIIVLHS